jgi:hypothetical protein
MSDFTDSSGCKNRFWCERCRDTGSRGKNFRQFGLKHYTLPADGPDFSCPAGVPWDFAPANSNHEISNHETKKSPAASPAMASAAATSPAGVGAAIKSLLQSFGVAAKPGCGCNAVAARWDAAGLAWCELHQAELTDYLVSQGKARGWLLGVAARMTAPAIVAEAIARVKAARRGP